MGGNKIEIYNSMERSGFTEKMTYEPRFEAGGETFPYRQCKSPKIKGTLGH